MAVEHQAGGTSLIDVLDRVLDKGIIIDMPTATYVSLEDIDLLTIEDRSGLFVETAAELVDDDDSDRDDHDDSAGFD